jgi:hypothetical protein
VEAGLKRIKKRIDEDHGCGREYRIIKKYSLIKGTVQQDVSGKN